MCELSHNRARVFLSYAHVDGKSAAERLAVLLERADFDVWWDRERLHAGASWTVRIEQAIDSSDVVLALLSKASFVSDICRAEQLRALRKSKAVIPILVQSDADRPLYIEAHQYVRLIDGSDYEDVVQRVVRSMAAKTTAKLESRYWKRYVTAPPLPSSFVRRDRELEALRRVIIRESGGRHVAVTAVRAMGGIGKTVLAQALCSDEAVQDAFPDGVIWVSIGRKVTDLELIQHLREVAKALGDDLSRYDTLPGCSTQLRNALRDRAALLVLDDVWSSRDVRYFMPNAPRSKVLLTTRQQEVVRTTAATEVSLDLFDQEQARLLLSHWSGLSEGCLPVEADQVIEECGRLPLAIAMVGAIVRDDPPAWRRILRRLRSADLEKIRIQFPDCPYPDLMRCIEVSVESLQPTDRARYVDFAVFRADTPIPTQVLRTLWDVDQDETDETVRSWAGASLAQLDSAGRVSLHDLQLDYVKYRASDLKTLHKRLIANYRKRCSAQWHAIADDQYYLTWLPYHLAEAGNVQELERLVLDPQWMRRKLTSGNVSGLLADYTYISDEGLQVVREAIELSAHFIARYPQQLPAQLIGRLGFSKDPRIRSMLSRASEVEKSAWLRPLASTLRRPGGPLRSTLVGHADVITAVAVRENSLLGVSSSADGTICIWDLGQHALQRTIEAHQTRVNGVCLLPNSKFAVSAGDDATIRLWNLQSGSQTGMKLLRAPVLAIAAVDENTVAAGLQNGRILLYDFAQRKTEAVLHEHDGPVNALAVSARGRKAVSASDDELVLSWDLQRLKLLHMLEGHTKPVVGVAITKSGHKGLSGSHDGTAVLWDLSTRRVLARFGRDGDTVSAVALSRSGEIALIGSGDNSILVWDTAESEPRGLLQAHSASITAMALASDSSVVSGSEDRTMRVWDFRRRSSQPAFSDHGGAVSAIIPVAGGGMVLSGARDSSIMRWVLSPAPVANFLAAHRGPILGLCGSSDGSRVVSVCEEGSWKRWRIGQDGMQSAHMPVDCPVRAVCATGDLLEVLAIRKDGRLVLIHERTGVVKQLTGLGDGVFTTLAISEDGFVLAAVAADNTMGVWRDRSYLESAQPNERFCFGPEVGKITALAVDADGSRILAGTAHGHVIAVGRDGAAPRVVKSVHSDQITSIRVIRGRDMVAMTSLDQYFKILTVVDLRVIAAFGGDSAMLSCTYLDGGSRFGVGDQSGRVHFLDLVRLRATREKSALA